ncbi:MAG: LytR family transcriptional regulator [Bacteroidia bacterium]|nr:LytR family transcriptional regulator [Bacteroidia bacterium]
MLDKKNKPTNTTYRLFIWNIIAIILFSLFASPMTAMAQSFVTSSPMAEGAVVSETNDYDNPLINPQPYAPVRISDNPGLQNIINILLLGFDADYKSYAENGGDSHTDAMMVASINIQTNTISLISLPRDTLTYVPGIRGIYKLNGSVNAGGGKTEAGLLKATEAASVLLGYVPIDYYFGIDMEKVKDVGDLLGGVDLNVTIAFTTEKGKRYSTGLKHLDGEAIYSYMRARKSAEGTDKGRTKRQRAVIAAMIEKIQKENQYFQLPKVLASIQDGYYTNITSGAILTLLPVALSIDAEDIGLYTMEGSLRAALNDWNIHFIDQEARLQLIKQVFGVDAKPIKYSSYSYCQWLVGNGNAGNGMMSVLRYLYVADQVMDYAQGLNNVSQEITIATDTVRQISDQLRVKFCLTADVVDQLEGKYTSSREVVRMDQEISDLKKALLLATTNLANLSGFPGTTGSERIGRGSMRWIYPTRWETDPAINEVYVNFH